MNLLIFPFPALDTDSDLVNEDPEEGEKDADKEKENRKKDSVVENCHDSNQSHADYS